MPTGTETDTELLARLQAVELAAAALHDAVAASPLLDATTASIVSSLAAHHRAHAAGWGEGIDRADGSAAAADPDVLQALFPAIAAAADGPSMLRAALAVEQAMAATAVDACARFGSRSLASLAGRIAAVEARHNAVLAVATSSALDVVVPPVADVTAGSLL